MSWTWAGHITAVCCAFCTRRRKKQRCPWTRWVRCDSRFAMVSVQTNNRWFLKWGYVVLGPKSCIDFNKDKTSWRFAEHILCLTTLTIRSIPQITLKRQPKILASNPDSNTWSENLQCQLKCFFTMGADRCFVIIKSSNRSSLLASGLSGTNLHFSSFLQFWWWYQPLQISYHLNTTISSNRSYRNIRSRSTNQSITGDLLFWWSLRRSRKAFEIVEANPPYQHASKTGGMWEVGLPNGVPNGLRGLEGNLLVGWDNLQLKGWLLLGIMPNAI